MAQQHGGHDPHAAIQDAFLARLASIYLIKLPTQIDKMKAVIRDPNNGYKEAMSGFLKPEDFIQALYVFQQSKDSVSLSSDPPPLSKYKKKAYIILRIGKEPLTDETVKSDIIFVEMTQNLLEHMYVFCNQILGPVMQNPDNQVGWSDLVTKDLMDRFNNFVAQNYVMIGLSKGRTLLPLPNKKIMNSDGSEKDKAHIFEGCIVTWTKQIKNVLKLQPEQALKNGNNPGPMTELQFWQNKANNLNSIYDQLQSVEIKGILRFLERSKSTYTNPFTKLQRQVYDARVQANQNTQFLQTLRDLFTQLCDDTQEFQNLHELFPPIMHTFLKIYTHSRFYNTPPRLVVLIKETCNEIIARASEYINGGAVASALNTPEEIGQVCKKLETTIDICGKFKEYYFQYKRLSQGKWKLTLNALFSRLDAYSQRCHDILHLTTTIMQFNKLEKIQLGGTKGKTLTETLKQISDQFKKAVENFRALPYDTMDITQKSFDNDFMTFRQKIKELERRLASVITQGFDDNDTIMGKFKELDCFEGILNRPIIQDELEKKHAILLDMYKQDLKSVQTIFLEGKILIEKNDERSPIYNNYPPVAGTLTWCKTLKDRINEPFKKLDTLGNGITERQEYKDVHRLHDNILRIIQDYEQSKFVFWEKEVDENTNEKLKQSLLCKDQSAQNKENGLLKVNFDHTLVRLLREVKYLKLLGSQVPETAQKLFAKADTYRTQVVSLELIVQNYNKIITCLNDVEEPLVKKRIVGMDQQVEPGIVKYRWDSPQINQFIRKSKDVVDSLYEIVDKMKKSLQSINVELEKLKKPMIERKNKPISPEEYDNILKAVIANKLTSVKDCGVVIHKLLKQVNDAVKFDKKQPEWKKYTQYINTIVIDGICQAICFALDHLNEQINSEKMDQSPLFEIKLQLEGKKGVVYEPEIDKTQGSVRSVCDTLRGWVNQIFSIAHNFPRLDATTSGPSSGGFTGDYLIQTKANFLVKYSMSRISSNLSLIVKKTQNIKQDLKKYSYLWEQHPEQNFTKFLQENQPKIQKQQGDDNIKRENILLKGCIEIIPDLQKFDEKITKLKQLQIEVSKILTPVEKAWIKIDLRNFIKALQVKINTFMKVYTDFLSQQFKTTLKNLKDFNHRTTSGLKTNPKDVFASTQNPNERQKQKNRALLMKVMKHISEMKSVKGSITGVIQRMRSMVIKLKKHGINVAEKGQEEPLQAIQASEGAFNQTQKKVNQIKKDIINIIGDEAIQVKKKLDIFNVKVNEFKTDFKANLPYNYDENMTVPQILKNYEKIDEYYVKLLAFEKEAKENSELEDLFQLQRRQYKPLKQCLSDLKNLKTLWDLITMVNLQYNDWKTKLWRQIKADVLIQQNKVFQKQIKDVAKDVRVIKGCQTINDKVQNMNVVLNLVESLRGDYMEERHWQQLKNKTKSDIDNKSQSFSFNEILELKLHKVKPEVEQIVDIAQKQFKIDKKLKIIESNWSKQIFQFEMYKEWYIFAPLDDMVEILDANSLDLMGMKAQGKYVQFFIDIVQRWREQLTRVDTVVQQWLKVQKNWRILVNIFVGSDDIRQQLPEDTKVFETVHGQFTEMMIAAHESPLIIEACNESRKAALVEMSAKIKKCQKALNDYLEQKKKVFPRFYFLSNQSLLTILSNGQNPPKVCQFIGDCFDGLKTLRFKPSPNPNQFSRIADGMYSKDDEQINFKNNFVAEGQVEIWLRALQYKMRSTLYEILCDAKSTCETWDTGTDKPRQEWIGDYCSQLALLTTQIVWTEDVNRAFEQLSSGAEGAMKECVELIKNRITKLITKVTRPLDILERMKVINIITIDVHSRDVVQNFVAAKVNQGQSFAWQSQLKFEWSMDKNNDVSSRQFCRFPWESDNTKLKCIIRIVDWFRFYSYEYVGNTLRLVITPLTDRCYITLTQALNLVMGGAPAGPAGTGKTQTTKDLGRAVGLPVIVFNCSDQMNKDSMAQIFMGLCQSGAWGCFDEFNRISIEVLSVVSTQVKTCLDAQKQKKRKFIFLQQGQIALEDTAGFFITMNPGYAGRTQLPDNLKALFRSCAMVVPDLILICQNMLMSQGFILARQLSKKFVALYMLSRELLSKQRHYDWGLRAVKSVLRQAGKLKRDPENEKIEENPLLMRALRDFNLPKIVTDDKPIFVRLIEDLFPNAKPEKKKPSKLQKLCQVTTKNDMGLYVEEQFIIKCIDTSDILEVRHCMFIIGPPGCGKTTVWKTLLQTHKNNKEDGESDTLNPKAVTSDQLFGCYTKTKQWRNGVLSMIMKNQNKCEQKYKKTHVHKWSILDGDVDPEWIQSLNTVMDDNKVLTLVSNDRIPLTPSMRLLFEVSNLKNATPATVSRGGVLFINQTDIGWQPFVNSWLDRSQPYMKANDDGISLQYPPINEVAKAVFFRCFQAYIETPSDMMDQTKITYLAPPSTMGFIQTICTILDGILQEQDKTIISLYGSKQMEETLKLIYEALFVFGTMWAYGGSVGGGQDDNEVLNKFNGVFRSIVKVKFPEGGLCYDYFYSIEQNKWVNWSNKIPDYQHTDQSIFSKIFVPTIHTTRLRFLLDIHLKRRKPVLFVGGAGTGKTQVIKDYLTTTKPEQVAYKTINFSSFTDAAALQKNIESMLDKKSGKTYGSAMNKTLIAFIDDLNMPYVDKYGTQSPIQLLRQIIDYGSIFNREQLQERKYIQDLLIFACLNHKSGSFTVDLRLQKNFSSFTMYTPTDEIIKRIFGQILKAHLSTPGFDDKLKLFSDKIMDATVMFFTRTIRNPQFSPSAKKFHYQFNFRELAKIIEGVMRSSPQVYKNSNSILRLWFHEIRRVFEDRFINNDDLTLFRSILKDAISKSIGDFQEKDSPFSEPLICTTFMTDFYVPNEEMTELRRVMKEKLDQYNDVKAQMNLVLFDQAIQHVCRITRIIELPAGHALLVGVGGSGKQSLARLSSFIVGYQLEQMVVTQSFGVADLRNFLAEMYRKIAKPNSTTRVYMITDSQIKLQSFLIPINDMLNSGWISDLFPKEDFDAMIGNLRNEAKGNGVPDNPQSLLAYFYDRMKKSLKVILCFSPVGQIMRIRARKFPGIINSTSIDWFHPWPRDALIDVANKFLQEAELESQQLRQKISINMAETHLSIDAANEKFRKLQRRNNYTTPKSFLELISFYKTLLEDKKGQIDRQIKRYTLGLQILAQTKSKVEGLQDQLKIKMVEVKKQRQETQVLIEEVSTQSSIAEQEQAKANEQQVKTNTQKEAAEKLAAECAVALAEAEPALKQAEQAVKCLQKKHVGEMKAFANPPPGVVVTCRVVLALLKQKVLASDADEKVWKKSQNLMQNPEKFLQRVLTFDGTDIQQSILENVSKIIDDPTKKYNQKDMLSQSFAASKLCAWSVNIVIFNRIFKKVRPLQEAKDKANQDLDRAMKELGIVKQQVRQLNEKVDKLKEKLAAAEQQKRLVEADAQRCSNKLTAAEKLVNGLAGQNKRWGENVLFLKANIRSVIGDVLLASQFVSYIGAFSSKLRRELWQDIWLPDIISKGIPYTEGIQPLKILTSQSLKAKWKNEGLPADNMSFENASIISSCSRWPLLIDPQLQGSSWIRGSQGDNLSPININQKHWMRQLTKNISEGRAVLLEGIQEQIEATLDPLLSRAIVKKAGSYSLELGSEVIDYDPKFKLFLMTKLTNPHFRPQIAAQCTIINFIVTQSGLEEQLLAMVVNVEKNELQVLKQELVKKQNEFQVILDDLQSSLLKQLSEADPSTILDNKELINNLEKTKLTATSIQEQSEQAKKTQININAQRQIYRPVAAQGAMLYFLCISLCIIDHMYQYSLESFIKFFFKAIERTQEKDETRVLKLIQNIRYTIYQWISRGLFEKHKLIFLTMITFRLMTKKNIQVNYTFEEMDFLIKGIPRIGVENPLDWLPDTAWNMVQALSQLDEFKTFAVNMEKDAPTRFKDWYNQLTPEDVKLPLQWKKLDQTPFKKLCVLRALRPDRITVALSRFIRQSLPKGQDFIDMDSKSSFVDILTSSVYDSEPQIPIFFILSPGSDPVKEVEKVIKKQRERFRIQPGKSFFNISLGQGQDQIARRRIEEGNKQGHWIMLQNIHLMPTWLLELEKILDSFSGDTGSHINFRLFLSAEPSTGVPIGLLDRSIKLTNQPPAGLKANMKRAFTYFPKQQIEQKDPKVKCILFALCFFHSTVIERKRFGPMGWNMSYPFNMGDLRDSYLVLNRYMQSASGSSKIPFEDLIYIFGQIMYGGHIVDDWDRRLARAYLENIMCAQIFEQIELFPYIDGKNVSFRVPLPTNYEKYIEHIQLLGAETPLAYGLHPNAEIGFRTTQCNTLFQTLLDIAPKDSGAASGQNVRTAQDILQEMVKRFMEDINIRSLIFSVDDIKGKLDADQKGPYQNVFIQQIQYMTILLTQITRSIEQIDQGVKGLLTISEKMQQTMDALVLNRVPASWTNLAYPSKRGLQGWIINLLQRIEQLNQFKDDPLTPPRVIMISKFFNPQSYLTAIKQVVAANAKGGYQLNKLYIQTDITKKTVEQIEGNPKDGAYCFGFILEGARWDIAGGYVQESKPKEMFSVIPVVYCKALPLPPEGKEDKTVYQCPAYKTQDRGSTYVFTAQLKTRHQPRKWILAGVAIIMDVQGLSDDTGKKKQKK